MDVVESYLSDRFADNPKALEGLITLYREYASWGLKDSKFDKDFTSGNEDQFYGYLWEMVLARHLKGLGLEISSSDEGPDLRIEHKGQVILVEAICPSPADLPSDWLEPTPSFGARCRNMPHEEMLLRWTAALKEKKEKHIRWMQRGIVGPNEPYVIAVSGSRLGYFELDVYTGISQYPFAVEAALPVGPIAATLNIETMELVRQGQSYRPEILNKNDAPVPTDNFLNPDYSGVSALLGSSAGFNAACGQRYRTAVVHNPLATNRLPEGIFGADDEFVAENKGDYFELTAI